MKVDKILIYFFSFPVLTASVWFPIRKRHIHSSLFFHTNLSNTRRNFA